MKMGSAHATGQNRKHRALKLLLPMLAFALLLGFGPQAGVSYAQPEGNADLVVKQTQPGDPGVANSSPAGNEGQNASENGTESSPGGSQASGGEATPEQPAEPSDPATPESHKFDLKSYLSDAKLFYGGAELEKDKDQKYQIHPDTPYKLKLAFAETPKTNAGSGNQFPEDGKTEMVMQLPQEILAASTDKDVDFAIYAEKEPVTGNKFGVTKDNKIHVKLVKNDKLNASQQAEFFVTLDVKFAKDAENIELNKNTHMDVLISNNPDLAITKSARHDFAAGKVFYTLTVTSIDTNENVVISDQIAGDKTVLTLDKNPKSIKVKSTNKKAPKPGVPVFGKNGFKLTIPKMTHGEQVTVEYAAFVDYSQVDPVTAGTKEQTTNTANVLSDQLPTPKKTENNLEHQLKIGSIVKNAGAYQEKEGKPGVYTQQWTIKVNEYLKLNVQGYVVEDSIPGDYKDIMKYSGDGLTLKINKGEKDTDGKPVIEEKKIPWEQVGINDLKTDTAWKYKLPDNLSYEISYETTVDVNAKILPKAVSNQASSTNPQRPNDPEKVTAPTSPLRPAHVFKVAKKAISANKKEVEWQIAVTVVPQGYKSLKLTDNLPTAKSNNKTFQDKLKLEELTKNIKVAGLLKGESWKFAKDETNPDGRFTIEFFKNKEQTEKGLQKNTDVDEGGNPKEREVTVTFFTTNNRDWVEAYEAGDNSLYRHVNMVKAEADGEELTTSAEATPTLENIDKTFNEITYKEIDGVDYPLFHYRLRLEGLAKCNQGSPNTEDPLCKAETLKIFDEFDARKLKLSTDPKPAIEGTDKLRAQEENGKIDFLIKKSDLPKQGKGKYQSVYYLEYSLIPANRAALNEINKDPNGLKVKNKATWGPITTQDVAADYVYEPLTKELAEKPVSSNHYEAKFKVAINPGALDIANGSPTANFKDQMTNLRLQPETLEMTPKDFNYHPVYKDGVLTMAVPNKQKVVVTYTAKVIGKDLVNYGNEVEVGKDHAAVNGSVAVQLSSLGLAPNPGITIRKHDSRDLTTRLEGAEFELNLVENGKAQPVVGKLSADQVQEEPLRFTTDENGEVTIKGDKKKLGWTLLVSDDKNPEKQYEYQLKEVKAPQGYQLLEEPITFKITRHPEGETQQYDGATIYVANDPEPGTDIPGNPGEVHKQLGKTGTQVSVVLGAMLACLAGGYLILRRREQR
ncbi:SpaA isopeptide-forming pilin-related protein [Varibaculum vaginae]|uniref:SpaA isopeptide-forming pilin-related protein n=1 Tax=Varibaculum vaginae TaxID=2364797 RepID=UPI000F08FA1F|nr:SpaA isopeptide-forming pilin-related protein [Varibaculum vaginae]